MAPPEHLDAVRLLSGPTASTGGTDWRELRRQKRVLVDVLSRLRETDFSTEAEDLALEGLLSFLDCITDAAEDAGLLSSARAGNAGTNRKKRRRSPP